MAPMLLEQFPVIELEVPGAHKALKTSSASVDLAHRPPPEQPISLNT